MALPGKGIEDTGATREGPPGTAVRDFSEIGELRRFGFWGSLCFEDPERRSGGAEGLGMRLGARLWFGVGSDVGWSSHIAAPASLGVVEVAMTGQP